jgi:hypothetical protein
VLATAAAGQTGPSERPASSDNAVETPIREGVQGRVTSGTGQAVADVLVQARSLARPSQPVPDLAVMTDRTGSYQWVLGPGRYEFAFVLNGQKLLTRQADVARNAVTRLDVQIPARN